MALACPKPLSLYRPRDTRASDLWRLMDEHFESFRHVYDEPFQAKYGFWRPVVARSVTAFLKCGDLQEGFARVRCPDCHHEMFVAFSSKQPTIAARRCSPVPPATKKCDDEAPAIHKKIADLQTTLAEPDRGVTESQADVGRREKAAAWLREPSHVPPAQKHSYHSQRKSLNARLRPGIDRLESRLKTIDGVTALEWETHMDPQHEHAVNHCRVLPKVASSKAGADLELMTMCGSRTSPS